MRSYKRVIAFLMTSLLLVGVLGNNINLYADEMGAVGENIMGTPTDAKIDDSNLLSDVAVESENSVGDMLEDILEDAMAEESKDVDYKVGSVEIIDGKAQVRFDAKSDATLIVGLYDEATNQMITSGTLEVNSEVKEAKVDFDDSEFPAYFILRAYLVDSKTLQPLSDEYMSELYTEEMQEFLSKTTDDFEQDKVLNFDDDKTNNFAVFCEDTILIPENENTNIVSSIDDANKKYVFDNADDYIKNLSAGDVFAYDYNSSENELLIVKVASIEIDGDTVTVYGTDTSLEEVFDYVRIDEQSSTENVAVSDECEEGVQYVGMVEMNDIPSDDIVDREMLDYDKEGSKKIGIKYKFIDKKLVGKESDDNYVKLSGSIEFSIDLKLELYISFTKQYFKFNWDTKLETDLSITGKVTMAKVKLALMEMSPCPGVYFRFTPSFIISAELEASIKAGFCYNLAFELNGHGFHDRSTGLTSSMKSEITGKIFIGLSFEPEIKIIDKDVADMKCSFTAGIQIKGVCEVINLSSQQDKTKRHLCSKCITGSIDGIAEYKLSITLAKIYSEDTGKKINIHIKDFYYSFDTGKLGWGKCPNYDCKVTLYVKDNGNRPISNVQIVGERTYNTDKNGKVSFYIKKGETKMTFSALDFSTSTKKITVDDKVFEMAKPEITVNMSYNIPMREFCDKEIFKDFFKSWDKNNNGYLSDKEISELIFIGIRDIDNIGIDEQSIAWIKYFYNLSELNLSNCKNLKNLDISKNKRLEKITCDNVGLTSLNISSNTNLTVLTVKSAKLSSLDTKNNKKLTKINCSDNQISYLDLSNNSALKELDCRQNNIGVIVLNKDANLKKLLYDSNAVVIRNFGGVASKNELFDVNGNDDNNIDREKEDLEELEDVPQIDSSKYIEKVFEVDGNHISDVNLYPNHKYNLYVVKTMDDEAEDYQDILKDGNALYVKQYETDENGTISIDYLPKCTVGGAKGILVCEKNITLGELPEAYIEEITYDGEEHCPYMEIYSGDGSVLVEGIDYMVSGDCSVKEPGDYTVNAYGIGKYIGSIELNYSVIDTRVKVSEINLDKTSIDMNVGDETTISAAITPEDAEDKTVEWSSNDSDIVEVDQNGNITAKSKGTATICCKASDGSEVYANCEVRVIQPLKSIELNKTTIDMSVNDESKLVLSLNPQDADYYNIKWASSDESIVSVDDSGRIIAKSKGSAEISCIVDDNLDLKATCIVNVKQLVDSVSLNKTSISLLVGKTYVLKPSLLPEDADDKAVTWKSSNTKVATVSSSGKITAKAKGKATITCSTKDGSGKKVTCSVVVKQPVKEIVLNKESITISKGNSITLKATVKPTNADNKLVKWSSSDTSIVTVSSNGVVTGKAKGKAKIICSAKDGSGVKTTIEVTVKQLVTKISLNSTKTTMLVGDKLSLKARVAPSYANNRNVTWSSNNKDVASVNKYGEVIAKKAGKVVIACAAKDGSGVKATCVITVKNNASILYTTHVQSYGWQGDVNNSSTWKKDGEMAGTSGEAKRLEGIKIVVDNPPCEGSINYITHVQTYGWQGDVNDSKTWKKNGEMAGTSGEAKRLEAICITLTGELANKYDVYYRVHAQSFGWLGWAKNGEPSGTAGFGKRLEGIQIILVRKGNAAPSNDYDGIVANQNEAYIEK